MTAQKAVVLGLGRFGGGAGAVLHLAQGGYAVTVVDGLTRAQLGPAAEAVEGSVDRWLLEDEANTSSAAILDGVGLVVANPAVRPDHPLLGAARSRDIRVTTEVGLLLEACPARMVLVTGTQGKSSTCKMTADLIAAAGIRVHLGGNIGGSLLESLDRIEREGVVVLELSSYQLEHLATDPHASDHAARVIAVAVTNILPDHLERHGTIERYAEVKRSVLDLLGEEGTAFLPTEDAHMRGWAPQRGALVPVFSGEGLHVSAGEFRFGEECLGQVSALSVPGRFQVDNALFALALAYTAGASPAYLAAAIPGLTGLEHRVQTLGARAGHPVIDNAVSTTPDSTASAIAAVPEGSVLLCGGRDKGLPREAFLHIAAKRVGHAFCFGEAGQSLSTDLAAAGVRAYAVASLEDAVRAAFETAPSGAAILFSPACSSFDSFNNFSERASAFLSALPPPDPA